MSRRRNAAAAALLLSIVVGVFALANDGQSLGSLPFPRELRFSEARASALRRDARTAGSRTLCRAPIHVRVSGYCPLKCRSGRVGFRPWARSAYDHEKANPSFQATKDIFEGSATEPECDGPRWVVDARWPRFPLPCAAGYARCSRHEPVACSATRDDGDGSSTSIPYRLWPRPTTRRSPCLQGATCSVPKLAQSRRFGSSAGKEDRGKAERGWLLAVSGRKQASPFS
jgi:hypothetical protein